MSILSALFGPGAWGTGGNIIAAALLTLAGWLLRDRLGRRLAAWWHAHRGEHLSAELAEHVRTAVAEHLGPLETRLREHAEAQHAQTRVDLVAGIAVAAAAAGTTSPPDPAPAPQPAPAPKEA